MFEPKRWCGVSKTKTRWSKLYGGILAGATDLHDQGALTKLRLLV